jgi:hypothetical protein
VEWSRVVVNLEAVTLHDEGTRPLGTVRGWLDLNDPLRPTREFPGSLRVG